MRHATRQHLVTSSSASLSIDSPLERVHTLNQQCEYSCWIAEQALHCHQQNLSGDDQNGSLTVWS